MKYMVVARKFARNLGTKVTTGVVLLGGSSIALADAAAAAKAMEAKGADIDTIGWASVGLSVAVAIFAYVRRAAR